MSTKTLARTAAVVTSILATLTAIPSYGAAQAPTQSAVPNSDGGQVKSGDVIIWNTNKAMQLEPPSDANVTKPATASVAAKTTAATAADTAAAAAAIKAAAHKVVPSEAPAAGAPAVVVAQYNATASAAAQADATEKKATDDLSAATDKTTSSSGTVLAAGAYLQAAQKDSDEAAVDAGKAGASAAVIAKYATAYAYLAAAKAGFLSAVSAPATPVAPAQATTDLQRCFPKDSLFQVSSVIAAATTTPGGSAGGNTAASPPAPPAATTATVSNTQLVSGYFSSTSGFWTFHWLHNDSIPLFSRKTAKGQPPATLQSPCVPAWTVASYDTTYTFTADKLSEQDFIRNGFTWGGLVIPYKFYFTDKSIKSNSSTVAFAGYEGWFPGISLSAVLALGPGMTTTTTTTPATTGTSPTPATTSSSTTVTYTAAVGFIAAFGDSKTVKAGLLFGRDYQGHGSGFQYENKTWMALSIGAGF